MAVLPLAAGTIVDVSTRTAQQMNPGDTLFFLVSDLSIASGAIDSVEFQFITQPIPSTAQFAAELTSRDGSISIAFAALDFQPGYFTGAGYRGPISSISGTVDLSPTLAEQIFQNTHATLVLENVGPSITVKLPGYTLAQDVSVSLSSGNTMAGAVTGGALYEDPPPPPDPTPEGDSGFLVAGAGR
jgi:hypothetical protein